MTPPNSRSVQRASRFCSTRRKNDVLPETLGPLTISENGCLNLISTLVDRHAVTRLSPLPTLHYLYPNGTDVTSANRRLVKNEILYRLSSGSVTIDTVSPPFHLRLMFFSVCTFATVGSPPCSLSDSCP